MENKLEIEFRSISVGTICPICQKKYAVRIGINYLSQHMGEQLQTICCSCAKKQIAEGRVFNGN
jgi:hypothetical protein